MSFFLPMRLWWVGIMIFCARAYAAEDVVYAAPSAWVKEAGSVTLSKVSESASGVAYDLCDNQTNIGQAEEYTRRAVHVLSEAGRAHCGELRFSFAPSYQTLTIHHLRIQRSGQILDRLDPKKIKILRREQSAEQGLYDGRLTVLAIVEDLRVGDVLDYALSLRGTNPVFGDKYSDSWSMQDGSPIQRLRVRLLLPEGRVFKRRSMGPVSGDPVMETRDGVTEWLWDRRDLPAIDFEYGAPTWYLQYPVQQISEYADWASVVEWGAKLYPLDSELPEELEMFIASLRNKSAEEGILAALHRVQGEIRYLSLSLGESTHRPHAPKEIYANRFGDCKDKAFLLAVLLQRMGFDAVPALVNTSIGKGLNGWLPTPHLFDHVILHVRLNKVDYWLDPTRQYQAGTLADHSVTSLAWALPLRKGTTGLQAITQTESTKYRMIIDEAYHTTSITQPVELNVQRTYRGAVAETMRAFLADNTPERVGKDGLNSYSRMYPTIIQRKEPHWTDDKATNCVRLMEYYTIPNFWKHNQPLGTYKCDLSPLLLNEWVDQPARPRRSTPMDYGNPYEIESRICMQLPTDLQVAPVAWTERTEAFEFKKRSSYAARKFEILYTYKSTSDTIAPERMEAFVQQISRIRERMSYTLTLPDKAEVFSLNWSGLVVVLLVAGIGVYAAIKVLRWKRPGKYQESHALEHEQIMVADRYEGLGGWLILVGIILVRMVSISMMNLPQVLNPVMDLSVWNNVTMPGSAAYHVAYAPILLSEAVNGVMAVIMSVLAIVLYFRKHWFFPKLMIVIVIVTPVFRILDTIAASSLPLNGEAVSASEMGQICGGVIGACIWISYFSVSKRVKATFVR